MTDFYPLVIVGGGPVGLTLMGALHQVGRESVLFEHNKEGSHPRRDGRSIVLLPDSVDYLISQGLLSISDLFTIDRTDIFRAQSFSRLTLHASDYDINHLAYCINYTDLLSRIRENAHSSKHASSIFSGMRYVSHDVCDDYVSISFETSDGSVYNCRASHLIIACSLLSGFRELSSIRHYAILGSVALSRGVPRCAYEILGDSSVITLLPQQESRWSFIEMFTDPFGSDELFLSAPSFFDRLRLSVAGRLGYPSDLEYVASMEIPIFFRPEVRHGERVLFMGSAAQILHPIGARGINFSLSNIRSLANCMRQFDHCGSESVSLAFSSYEKRCRSGRRFLWRATGSLSCYLTQRHALFSALGDCGLFVLGGSKLLKSILRGVIYSCY
ncbi:FAD-dependent monooxygenase [Candidatus Ichthyocystis hellenicum]|uniref:FAD-dependent monooxygenase n=1 Tax=Candidatus Ichthyocystis hellenicum TaxID=1561003 RepID=UPI000B87E88B|nr:NAD(P)/FAD-dependent oxidoreductase [Candidatus Ichthyocystis hellenicum]